jgi:hypothetical protein
MVQWDEVIGQNKGVQNVPIHYFDSDYFIFRLY